MSELGIDPETLLLTGYDHQRRFSAAEFAELEAPRCTVCGAKVSIQQIDVTFNEADERANGRTYIPGMWHCPHGCNPRTGQRLHGDWEVSRSMGEDWVRFRCNCGADEYTLTNEELAALRDAHVPGYH